MIEDLKPYPQYKDSGLPWLGEVPAHWPLIPNRGLIRRRKVLVGERHCEYRLLSLTKQGVIVRDLSTGKGKFTSDMGTSQEVRIGDLVFCLFDVPETPRTVGLSTQAGMITGAYTVFEPLDRCCATYFELFYRAMDDRKLLSPLYSGLRNTIPAERFLAVKTPQPPPEEQAAIARFLAWATNRLDRAIGAKRRIIALLQEQKQAIIHRAVTRGLDPSVPLKDSGIPWLGEIPEHWEVARIKTEFECLNSRRIPLSTTERGKMKHRQYDYYGASGIIDKVDEYLFDDDLILIAEDGANLVSRNLPLAIIARGKYWVNNHAHILKPRKGRLEYLAALLECMDYRPWISGAAQPKLTQDRLMSIRIALPPPEEQSRIAEEFKNEAAPLELSIRELHQEVNLLREYRTRLIADVVTGKLDVREVAKGLPEEELQIQPDVESGYDADESEYDAESNLIDTAED